MYFLGYDIGSSSIKACLLDAQSNKAVNTGQHPETEMVISAPRNGWAEQDPEVWWECVKQVTHKILSHSRIDPDDILAIGISYQMHGLVLVDHRKQLLRPSIIWCDSRAVKYGAKAFHAIGETRCLQNLLNSPGNFTASKLAWVKENERHIYDKIYKFMLPGDFIAMRLTGEAQTTYSGLSEGVFYDFSVGDLSEEIMTYFGFDHDMIPDIVPTFGIQSSVCKEAADYLGLSTRTKVTYRAGDQPNNSLSLNVLNPGELAATAGTSGVVYGVSEELCFDEKSRVNTFAHVNHLPERPRTGILLCINGTGITYSWARKNFQIKSYEEMNKLAGKAPIGSDGLVVMPFGNGAERILENRSLGAHFGNISFNLHTKEHICRAIQEGIAFSFRYGIDIMKNMGFHPDIIRAGKANLFLSPLFRQALANLTGARIELFNTDGAQGAARGAGIGFGYYNFKEAFNQLQMIDCSEPSIKQMTRYAGAYERWKAYLSVLIESQHSAERPNI